MLEIIVLAAGRGARMKSSLPKVLHSLAGRPLLDHVLATARQLSPRAIHVVVGHGADQVRSVFGGGDIQFHDQPEQLGTGHAVQQALPACDPDSTVLVLFGDVPRLTASALANLVDKAQQGPAMLSAEVEDPSGYGRVVRDGGGQFLRVVEDRDALASERDIREVNTGVIAAPFRHLADLLARVDNANRQGEYYLPDVLALARSSDLPVSVATLDNPAEMAGVNSPDQLERLERAVQGQQAEALLQSGVQLADRARIDVRGDLQCEADVFIDVNCVFEGTVLLRAGVRIGANCVIRDSQIAADSVIHPFCHLEQASVGARCSVGPFARLRPLSEMGEGARVGNFVEMKKAVLGSGSKANHLAYIGDADIGAGTNLGAGTITCNYDGVNKHATEIGDDVFIGSNSTLVAPLTIAPGGFVAAGSTVTRDIASDTLAVGRARQRNVTGWRAPSKREKP